jgi:hypothetical protein
MPPVKAAQQHTQRLVMCLVAEKHKESAIPESRICASAQTEPFRAVAGLNEFRGRFAASQARHLAFLFCGPTLKTGLVSTARAGLGAALVLQPWIDDKG